MVALWFAVLCLMIVFFVVLDGWDFGAGVLHYLVARNADERRMVIAALGPLWSWHEVWLVGTGGVLFVAFPRVLAAAFPAYYLALFLVLWTLLLRGLALEFRSHLDNPMWQSFWDVVFAGSSASLAILFGAAVGNVMRGMPITPDTALTLPLFTNFGVRGKVGILDWYTISTAVFALVCLTAHGASYLTMKTSGEVYARSRKMASWLWVATFLLLSLVTVETTSVRPELFSGMLARPLAWVALLVAGSGLTAIVTGLLGGAERRTFLGGCALIVGLLGTAAASLFPVMLHSTLAPEYSITAWNGSSDPSSLRVAAFWWPFAFLFAIGYFVFVGKHYGGRVEETSDSHQPY